MKIDYRDVAWSLAALVLLCLLGFEWRRSHLIAEEIRQKSTAEATVEFVNAKLAPAAFFLMDRYNVDCEVDWRSLQPLGLKGPTRITRTIQADTAQQAFEQLFGEQAEVIEGPESSRLPGRSILYVQARKKP